MKRAAYWLSVFASTALGLLLLETGAYMHNRSSGHAQPFLVNTSLLFQKNYRQLAGYGYRLIDPLLGWGLTDEAIKNAGYAVQQNTVVLKSGVGCRQPIKIWIGGGSTTDVVLNKNNWPIVLQQMLQQHGICADLFIAATGGFSSGQELLKLIRDGTAIQPDVCISYSGANEHVSPAYVSRQEQHFYYQNMKGQKPYALLPNTVYLIREQMFNTAETLHLLVEDKKDAPAFWANNMQMMHAICSQNHCTFIGVLQPVAGVGVHRQPDVEKKHSLYVQANQKYYPAMMAFADSTAYLHNATTIFDTLAEAVYIDDCHINTPYQPLVAAYIFKLISDNLNTTHSHRSIRPGAKTILPAHHHHIHTHCHPMSTGYSMPATFRSQVLQSYLSLLHKINFR